LQAKNLPAEAKATRKPPGGDDPNISIGAMIA
jgi:hypothetical protein